MYYRGMASLNGLPVFFIKIDESLESNQGIDMISCVDYPAIESNFVALADTKRFTFNADKQMLYGAILIPNQPIYRNDPKMGEYYVVFTEEEIIKMVRKLQAQKKTVNVNYQHQKDSQIEGAVIQEIWLSGKKDKSQDFGMDFPVNTAVVGVYIGNKEFWSNKVKTKDVMGFSIEGFLDMIMSKFNQKHKYKMEVKTSDGAYTLSTQDDTFTVGAEVTITATDGTTVNEGTFNLDNGSTIVVAAGTITAIEDSPSEPEGELSNEEVAVIQSAMKSQIDELKGMIETLNQKFSNLPASQPITKTVEPEVKESKFEALRTILNKHKNK
jgi:hypothetical protein